MNIKRIKEKICNLCKIEFIILKNNYLKQTKEIIYKLQIVLRVVPNKRTMRVLEITKAKCFDLYNLNIMLLNYH